MVKILLKLLVVSFKTVYAYTFSTINVRFGLEYNGINQ